jgi:heme-based aerotactic transducer
MKSKNYNIALTESFTALAASAKETAASITDREKYIKEMLNEINAIQTQSSEMIAKIESGKHDFEEIVKSSYQIAQIAEDLSYLNNKLTEKFKK